MDSELSLKDGQFLFMFPGQGQKSGNGTTLTKFDGQAPCIWRDVYENHK